RLAVLGMFGTLLAVSVILALLMARTRSSRSHAGRGNEMADSDLAFALAVIGMLLVSPITWDHYLLVLLLPLGIVWPRLRGRWPARIVLVGLLALLSFDLGKVMTFGLGVLESLGLANAGHWVATPLATLTALSIPCYALVGIFLCVSVPLWFNPLDGK